MSGSPTDRGYVVIQDEPDGSSTVFVAGALSHEGRPVEVSAIHTGVSNLVVGREVALTKGNSRRWSSRIVDVFDDGYGSVHIQGPWSRARSLDRYAPAR